MILPAYDRTTKSSFPRLLSKGMDAQVIEETQTTGSTELGRAEIGLFTVKKKEYNQLLRGIEVAHETHYINFGSNRAYTLRKVA